MSFGKDDFIGMVGPFLFVLRKNPVGTLYKLTIDYIQSSSHLKRLGMEHWNKGYPTARKSFSNDHIPISDDRFNLDQKTGILTFNHVQSISFPKLAEVLKAEESQAGGRSTADEAMTTPSDKGLDKTSAVQIEPGGIELNAKKMGLEVGKDGKGVEIKYDAAMIAEFQRGNFTGVEAFILRITPIQSALPILGFESPVDDKKLAYQ